MLRFVTMFVFLFLISSGIVANAAPTQLIPCETLFNEAPIIGKGFYFSTEHFKSKGWGSAIKPFFTMYVNPSFEPEKAIVVYETHNSNFRVERFYSTENIWSSLHEQAEQKFQSLLDAPQDADFDLPLITSQGFKTVSKQTAILIKQAIEFAIDNSSYEPDKHDQDKHYIDGTTVYFVNHDAICGWLFMDTAPGPATDMGILGNLLDKYLDGKTDEKNIAHAAEKVTKQ